MVTTPIICALKYFLFTIIKKSRSISDILGISLSLVCAIQCAIAPILLSIAPIIPRWAHFGHGWIWISFILFVAAWSIGRGFRKHKQKPVLYLAVFGVFFLLAGTLLEDKLTILMESAVFVTGGVLLTIAHWKNYKLESACSR
jgi:NhaP-type Na+/H+ or K+/H+ antiporter